jgi:hypothetical protein
LVMEIMNRAMTNIMENSNKAWIDQIWLEFFSYEKHSRKNKNNFE